MAETRYKDFWEFIKLLSDNGLLPHVVVIGSWAEYLYAQAGILPGFSANLRTLDIDFLVMNMRRPDPPVNVSALARDAGYTVDRDVLSGTTKIYTPGFMEIEFLILQQGAGTENVLRTNLGVSAQALRHLSVLKNHTTTAAIFGMSITMPIPEAYLLHKIVINEERGKKAEKDRQAISNLLPWMDGNKLHEVYAGMTKKEQRVALAYLKETGPELPFLSRLEG